MKELQKLSSQVMTRKEFLQFSLMAIAGVFGFKNFITYLLQYQQQKTNSTAVADRAKTSKFGSSKFGV